MAGSENINFNLMTDTLVPSNRTEFDINNAISTLPINVPSIAVIAQKTSAGTATANTPIACFSEQDAIDQSGQGSIGHLTIRALLKKNPRAELYNVPVDDGAGSQAAGTITVTNTATSTGF